MAMSLATFRTRAQVLYDVAGSAVLSEDEWDEICNGRYRALWGKIVGICKDWRISVDTFTLTAAQTRALPAGYRETFLVRENPGTEQQRILPRFTPRIAASSFAKSYRLQGTNLYIEPLGRCAGNYDHLYVPDAETLTLDVDEIDSELDKFSDWLCYAAANVALAREESEQIYAVQLTECDAEVTRWASNQRSAEPDIVDDVRGRAWGGRFGGMF